MFLLFNYSSFIGVETDQLVFIFFLYIFIKWFDRYERDDANPHKKAILSVLGVFAVTLKLSVAPIVILAFFVVYLFAKEKKYKEIIVYSIISVIIVLPYIVRGIIISGYLLYPLTSIDIFNFDWKIPVDIANEDRWAISIWGKHTQEYINENTSFEEVFHLPFSVWIRSWLSSVNSSIRIMFFVYDIAVLDWMVTSVRNVIKKNVDVSGTVPVVILLICTLYWFFSAPLVRYGGFLMPVFILSSLTMLHKEDWTWILKAGIGICFVVFLTKVWDGTFNIEEGYLYPASYQSSAMETIPTGHYDKKGNEIYFYYPTVGGHCDPDTFPGTNAERHAAHTVFRGEYLENGFRYE